MEAFRTALAGGHPNSLGRTEEVVAAVLADRGRLGELFDCYGSDDPVVRLRTSSALKRVEAVRHEWLLPWIDRLLGPVAELDQASARWTLAQLVERLAPEMSAHQRGTAEAVLRRNLVEQTDWVVLLTTATTLTGWAVDEVGLRRWLEPQLVRLTTDPRRSVSGRARKLLSTLHR